MLFRLLFTLYFCVSALAVASAETPVAAEPPDFSRQVRPILSDHCFACHGPDEQERQAGLRLDTAEAMSDVVTPGDVHDSLLLDRVLADDDMVMPPPEFHKPLSQQQKLVLRDWIASGAKFQQHWSFVAPQAAEPPDVPGSTVIDRFINAKLASAPTTSEPLIANPAADRHAQLRRVYLDLTGLPPTRQQAQDFLSDDSPAAYERLVDRLLETPAYAQHMARYWLDLVRYADTHGLHLDNYREMWPYRDWVINAFAQNMPFDQFITEQLAGDLLPDAGEAQKIASGFNRLNVTTSEGGSIYEEVFTRNVMDRTDAFGTIFLGLTTGCAVCHDHKFDPISQRDYYSLFAFFNSLDGQALDQNVKDPEPVISVPTEAQQSQLAELNQLLQQVRSEMRGPLAAVDQTQQAWEASIIAGQQPKVAELKPSEVSSQSESTYRVQEDHSVRLVGNAASQETLTIRAALPDGSLWQTLRLEALVDSPDQRVGASPNGNVVLSEISVEMRDGTAEDDWMPVPILYGFADVEQDNGTFAVTYAFDSKIAPAEGWAVAGHQQAGPRTAWFVMPALATANGPQDANDPQDNEAEIRVQLKYQSQFAQHQFQRVRLSLSDQSPQVPEQQQISVGPVHSVGPFPIENANPGYGRPFASQQGEFKSDEVFRDQDRDYRWQHRADLVPVEVNELPVVTDRSSVLLLHQKLTAPSAQNIELLIGTDDGHVIYLNGEQVGLEKGPRPIDPLAEEYELALKQGENDLYIKIVNHSADSQLAYAFRSPAVPIPPRLAQLLKVSAAQRTELQRQAIRTYYRDVFCLHPDWLALIDQEKGFGKAKQELVASFATTLIWKETAEPRQAHLLLRGQYDQPGDAVPRSTPSFLPPLDPDLPKDRLGLARWLTADNHPLTARVAVNRFWQQVFGTGLVKTSGDFGSQGEPPSHPELLDWLAVDFREHGWNVKRLMKSLVMSDAYRRSAEMSDRQLAVDPANRLLARGPRHRLDAEVLRDQALALSGLLVREQGGPSVKPPQPAGLWQAVGYTRSNTATFKASEGDDVYRRSVYMFWKRTSPPPQMTTFDAPSRESCTARRERTNTPLQALVMLNETQYVEAAKHLALRVLSETAGSDCQQQVAWLLETVLVRPATQTEVDELLSLHADMVRHYEANPKQATSLLGSLPVPASVTAAEAAAWMILANTALNLDEVVNK